MLFVESLAFDLSCMMMFLFFWCFFSYAEVSSQHESSSGSSDRLLGDSDHPWV